jgi:hypothetical protein
VLISSHYFLFDMKFMGVMTGHLLCNWQALAFRRRRLFLLGIAYCRICGNCFYPALFAIAGFLMLRIVNYFREVAVSGEKQIGFCSNPLGMMGRQAEVISPGLRQRATATPGK